MNRICSLLMPAIVGTLLLLSSDAFAQSEPDLAKIPLNNYLQAHATGNAELIRRAFHSDARIIDFSNGKMKSTSLEEFAGFFNGKSAENENQRKRTIERLDISGTAASATIVLDYPNIRFTDYMNLLKIDGEWKIVNKTFFAERKSKPAQ